MCSVTKEAYAIVLVTDTLKKKRQDTLINKNNVHSHEKDFHMKKSVMLSPLYMDLLAYENVVTIYC